MRERRARLGAVIVAVIVVVSLAQTLRAPFLYDDTSIIRDNDWLRGWGALGRVWSQPYWPTEGPDTLGLYRPLHIALLALTWNATGGAALAFHLYALLLAVATALAAWWLLRRATGYIPALAAAAWFAAHPLHVEAVASVANSSELLVVLFTIAMVPLLASSRTGGGEAGWGRAACVALAAAAALLSKESGLLALPVALVTAWGWRPSGQVAEPLPAFGRRNWRALLLATLALAVVLAARHVVLASAVASDAIPAQGLAAGGVDRVTGMLALWPRIAGMLVWPTGLLPFYGPTTIPRPALPLAMAAAAVAAIVLVLVARAARRGERRPVVALAWVVLTYLPASNLLLATGQIVSDRVLFGATVGVALAIGIALDVTSLHSGRRARELAVAVVVVMIAYGMTTSIRYTLAWRSHQALWTHLVRGAPAEHLGYKLLGMDARGRGAHAEAVAMLARAHRMAPADRQVRFELGQAQFGAGRYAEAVAALAPLLADGDVRGEAGFVALYLEAVGRAYGAGAVAEAARPLLTGPSAATAARYDEMARERIKSESRR